MTRLTVLGGWLECESILSGQCKMDDSGELFLTLFPYVHLTTLLGEFFYTRFIRFFPGMQFRY